MGLLLYCCCCNVGVVLLYVVVLLSCCCVVLIACLSLVLWFMPLCSCFVVGIAVVDFVDSLLFCSCSCRCLVMVRDCVAVCS